MISFAIFLLVARLCEMALNWWFGYTVGRALCIHSFCRMATL